MNKAILAFGLFIIAMACFLTAGMLVMSTNVIDEGTMEIDQWRAYQVLNDLNDLPLTYIPVDELRFRLSGTVDATSDTQVVIDEQVINHEGGLPPITGEQVITRYRFSENGTKHLSSLWLVVDTPADGCHEMWQQAETVYVCKVWQD